MPWSSEFDDPIPLPDGRQLVTLMDAGEFIQSLPKAKQITAAWRNATEALLLVIERNALMVMTEKAASCSGLNFMFRVKLL